MRTLWQDLRYGARMLMKNPGFSLIAILTLALGIGANTAIFSLLDQVMLRRLPVERPAELVVLRSPGPLRGSVNSDGDMFTSFSFPMYKNLREKNTAFAGLLARYAIPLSVSTRGQTERSAGELVSGNYFDVLGVRPALGRVFSLADDRLAGAHPVAVLSHAYWTRRFANDPTILNQTMIVNGHTVTIVGVARAGFQGVQAGQSPDLFLPLMMKKEMTPNWDGLEDWNDYWLAILGRLKPGLTPEQGAAQLAPTYRALMEEQITHVRGGVAETDRGRYLAKPLQLLPGARGRAILQNDVGKPLLVMFGMVLLVLLIACTNVANLLLVRGLGRQRELAIRLALGASRWQLIRQLLLESLLLSLLGGLSGLLLASWISDLLIRTMNAGTSTGGLSSQMDGRVLGFTFALSVTTGLLFGLLPAWRVTRNDMTPALKDQSVSVSASQSQSLLRKTLVGAQVSLTLLLLIGAGLMTRTLWNLRGVDLGIQPERMITFSIAPELSGYSPQKTVEFADRLTDALTAIPGAQGAAPATLAVLTNSNMGSNITVQGSQTDGQVNRNYIGAGFFSVMGTPLLLGREFTRADSARSQKVAIVNEAFVQHFLAGRNPLGARFGFGAGTIPFDIEIVGVVKNARDSSVRQDVSPFVYQPYSQNETLGQLTFYIRARQSPASLGSAVRQAARSLDADMPIYDVKTVDTVLAENLLTERVLTALSISFGLLAALLAGLGLYGVLAYWVVQRRHEIGIRVALGAAPTHIRRLVLGQGLALTATGAVVGLLGAAALARLLSSLLYGLAPFDPLTFGSALILLALIALFACWLPARRATRVDPIVALRNE